MRVQGLHNFTVTSDPESPILWCTNKRALTFTPEVLGEIQAVQARLREPAIRKRFDVVVWSSDIPGVYSLGGDVARFADLVRAQDLEGLVAYARACVDVVHANHRDGAGEGGFIVVTHLNGRAFGGGLEAPLSGDFTVATPDTRAGLPEARNFGLYAGMGAVPFITQKAGAGLAQRMVLDGDTYTARELEKMRLVDAVVEGDRRSAVLNFVEGRVESMLAVRDAVRVTSPSRERLEEEAERWARCALKLPAYRVEQMEKLVKAQGILKARIRRRGGPC